MATNSVFNSFMKTVFRVFSGLLIFLSLNFGKGLLAQTFTGSVGLVPDLQTVVPTHVQLVHQQGQDILRFSNGIANTGDGDWALRPNNQGQTSTTIQEIRDINGKVVLEHPATTFAYHPAHRHWHVGDIARFEIRSGSPIGPIVGNNSVKVTFCLIDWYKLNDNAPTSEKKFWDCDSPNSYQGISPGWVDQYRHSVIGQQIDMTSVPDGIYYLLSTSDPENKFVEKDNTNNTAWVNFRLYQQGNGNRKIEILGHSPCANSGLCGEKVPNR
ncbi:lysyl oxidase family protein [Merismopedia glauca]|uniref:Uncharacterized protein n=1 Tax=Merismopedia glauca CCAP 1448/3 TaxID=1296344 RepID=A0A2T1C1J8_9CYAN|nr:lysyl oxidase family protein [Merismopedia glauca]PSB02150.1 hypothetical protein C7B64_14570 [Merismopedia glauca CCAP 1448/3]